MKFVSPHHLCQIAAGAGRRLDGEWFVVGFISNAIRLDPLRFAPGGETLVASVPLLARHLTMPMA